MGLNAQELRALKTNLYDTKDSPQAAMEYAMEIIGGPNAYVIIAIMVFQNTLLETLASMEESV